MNILYCPYYYYVLIVMFECLVLLYNHIKINLLLNHYNIVA